MRANRPRGQPRAGAADRPLDPRHEGALLALRRAAGQRSRRDTAWRIADGRARRDGAAWAWEPFVMCAPIDARLRASLTSLDYARRATEAAHAARFDLGG